MITNIEEQVQPIDRDIVLHRLKEIPDDLVNVYVKAIVGNVDEQLLLKSIFTSSLLAAKHIIDGLDQIQLERLNTIVLGLISTDPLKNLREIREATFNIIDVIPESVEKGIALIDLIKSLDVDYDVAWKELAFISRQMNLLASAFLILNLGKTFEDTLLDQLSRIPTSEFNGIFELCEGKIKPKVVE